MAARKTVKADTGSNALVNMDAGWRSRIERYVSHDSATTTVVGGGKTLSTRGGRFSFNGLDLGTEHDVIVLGSVPFNAYYEGRFDPEKITAPACFALGDGAAPLAPAESGPLKPTSPQAKDCGSCWASAFGTGKRSDGTASRGKACAERRRVVLLGISGDGDLAPEVLSSTACALLTLPVTSGPSWAAFAKSVTDGLRVPLCFVVARVRIVPDPRKQYVLEWEVLRPAPKDAWETLLQRVDAAQSILLAPPAQGSDAPDARPASGVRQRKAVVR